MKRSLIPLTLIALVANTFAADVGKGWRPYFSKGDGESEQVYKINQVPNAPLPIKKPAGCSFKFPANGHINYLAREAQGGAHKFVQLRFKIEGQAKFIPLDGGPIAAMHLYMDESMPMMNAWWASYAYSVKLQDVIKPKGQAKVLTVKVPLTPENWGSIDGYPGSYDQKRRDDFAHCLKNMGHIGVTFGGFDGGYGHGVKIKNGGSATCTIIDVTFVDQ